MNRLSDRNAGSPGAFGADPARMDSTRLRRVLSILPVSLLSLTAAAAALVLPQTASAQCSGHESFCAEFHVGGSVQWGPPAPPPPPRTQVIIVEEEAPPPPVVVYQPAPPPPPTTVVVHETRPAPVRHQYVTYAVEPAFSGMGIHAHLGGMFTSRVRMGGIAGALRLRPNMGHFALDLGIGGYGGQDYNGQDRLEVPLTADVLLYVNPRSRLQFYGVAGVGVSFAHTQEPSDYDWRSDTYRGEGADYTYVGGQLGVGLELRLGRRFAINGDVRGFVRGRVDDNTGSPEFVSEDGRTTNTSGGVVGNIGATLYF